VHRIRIEVTTFFKNKFPSLFHVDWIDIKVALSRFLHLLHPLEWIPKVVLCHHHLNFFKYHLFSLSSLSSLLTDFRNCIFEVFRVDSDWSGQTHLDDLALLSAFNLFVSGPLFSEPSLQILHILIPLIVLLPLSELILIPLELFFLVHNHILTDLVLMLWFGKQITERGESTI